jgi:hypothetical protein
MSKGNILEVENLIDLKTIMQTCMTVVVAFTIDKTPNEMKKIVRKFLKRKSEIFPLITFVYMKVREQDRHTLNILKGTDDQFPMVYHIRKGNEILVNCQGADKQMLNDSFDEVEKYYIDEMMEFKNRLKKQNKTDPTDPDDPNDDHDQPQPDQPAEPTQPVPPNPELEKKKKLEKLVLLNKTCDDMKIGLIREVAKRKKIEENIEKKKSKETEKTTGKKKEKDYKR